MKSNGTSQIAYPQKGLGRWIVKSSKELKVKPCWQTYCTQWTPRGIKGYGGTSTSFSIFCMKVLSEPR